MANPIPEGFRTLTPHLVVKGANAAIDFYRKAFGAEVLSTMPGPDGHTIMHAEIRIGDSMLMICDDMPMMERWVSPSRLNGTSVGLAMYVKDCDAVYHKAIEAGGTESMAPMDAFWGDRYSKITDPFGHEWEICTHQEDLTPDQIGQRAEEFFSGMGECNV